MHKSFFESEAELYNSAIITESELMQNEFLPPSLITEGFFKNLLDKLTKKNTKDKNKSTTEKSTTPQLQKNAKYTVHQVTSEAELDKFEDNDDFVIEGFVNPREYTDEFWQKVANIFAGYSSYNGKPIHFYIFKGKLMNNKYDLAGDNAYKDDLPFLVVPLSTYNDYNDQIAVKARVGARYFGDVVYNNERREILAGRHTQVNTPTTEAVLLSEGLFARYNLKPFNGKFSNTSFKIRKRKTENVDLDKAIKYIQSNILPQADRLINRVANRYMPLICKTSDERKKKWVDKVYKSCSISLFKWLIGDEYCIKIFISLTNTEITFTGTISDKGDMRFKFNDCVTTR